MPDKYRTCKAAVRWGRLSRSGRPHPLDTEPREHGNVRLFGDGMAELLTWTELLAARAAGAELFVSHVASCPDRTDWRLGYRANGAPA